MPLRDHFRPPVNNRHHWGGVHGLWPMGIVRQMFDLLPAGFQAVPSVQLGSPAEVNIGEFDDGTISPDAIADSGGGGATLAVLAPTLTVEADLSEQHHYEVLVYDDEYDRQLVAAIEIVSPSNKDRPRTRELFVGKVASLLEKGVCVSIVDLVSIHQANLYGEVLALLGHSDPRLAPPPPHLYAVTLRSRKRPKRSSLVDAWFYPMTVGQPLPTLPIWLTPDLRVMLPLEPSYEETCRLLRIG